MQSSMPCEVSHVLHGELRVQVSPGAGAVPVQQRIAGQLHVIAGAVLESGGVGGPDDRLAHRSSCRCKTACGPSQGRNAVHQRGRAALVRRGVSAAVHRWCGACGRAMKTVAADRCSATHSFSPAVTI